MKRFLRYVLRIAGVIICLLFLFWTVLAAYVEWNKDALLQKARAAIDSRIDGKIGIGHMEVSLFRHFPTVMIQLSDVSLRDSGWARHGHELLRADRVDIGFAPLRALLKARLSLNTVSVEHATIYFYTDSTGYSNTAIFRKQQEKEGGGDLPVVSLTDVRWVIDKQDKHKMFDLRIQRLRAVIGRADRTLSFDINTVLRATSFSFRAEKGSFLRDKLLAGRFALSYNTASHILLAEKARLQIDGYPFVFSGRFFPTVKPDPFFLTIDAGPIPFRRAAALLTPHLQEKLDEYDIDKPVSIHARLDAGAADETQPQLQVLVNLAGGNVTTPTHDFTDVAFDGLFTNEWVRGKGREDENSAISLTRFTGRLDDIPLRADSVLITDLKTPQLHCDLHSRFLLTGLNDLLGSETLEFRSGHCAMDIRYQGPLSENDSAGVTVTGQMDLDSAGIAYAPYSFGLDNIHGRVEFRGQDLVVDHLSARTGRTNLRLKGVARNLVALIDHNAGDVSMDWTMSAAHLALEDFAGLAGRPRRGHQAGRRSAGAVFGAAAARIDDFLKNGLIHVNLDAADISYEDFTGAHARADLVFQGHRISLSQVRIAQSAGELQLDATIERQAAGGNPFTLTSHLDHVDLPGLFRAFDDFGQTGIGATNLKGNMDADINMTGLLTDRAKVLPNSLRGSVDFQITDGQLIDFEPMEKIHEKILKKRDLSEIKFGTLRDRLDIDSTTVTVHRMEIRSTAFTLYAEGRYDFHKGTDMSLQVPISNLKARASDAPPESRGNDSKGGLSLHLRAATGPDGHLRISWDPFRRALKKAKKP